MPNRLTSKRTVAAIRRAVGRTYDGVCNILSEVQTETELGTTLTWKIRRRKVACSTEPVGSEEELFRVTTDNRFLARLFLPAETDLRTTDRVEIWDAQGRNIGVWNVESLKDPKTADEEELEALITQEMADASAPIGGNNTNPGGEL